MNGWVIVYLPGNNIYQMVEPYTKKCETITSKVIRGSVKTIVACAQIYLWFKK